MIPSIARSSGGPAEVVRNLTPELTNLGVSTVLVTTSKGLSAVDADLTSADSTLVARCWFSAWTFAPGIVPVLWRAVGNADLVHVHSIHTFPSTVAMLIGRLRGKPVVLQPHGALNDYHLRKRGSLKRAYLRFVDGFGLGAVKAAIFSSSVEAADGSRALPGVSAYSLPLGVDSQLLTVPRHTSDMPHIVFLARLARKKRLDLLLHALATDTMRARSWKGVVAGPIDSDLGFDPIALATELGLSDRVDFRGEVDSPGRADILRAADIYVLVSDDESFGMSVAEAMASACATITTAAVGVAADAGEEGGVSIVEQSVDVLAAEMARLLDDPRSRSDLGERARNYARRNLTWNSIARGLAIRYSAIVGGLERP